MIIATGTGRCGTKTVAELFDMHHEYHIKDLIHPWYWHQGNQGDPWPDRMRALTVHLRDVELETFRCSSNIYIHFLREMYELDPDIRILWLVRDPREFCRSAMARGWHNRKIWSMCPEPGREHFDRWEKMTPIQRTAWIWTWRNRLVQKALEDLPEDAWMMIHTDDIYPATREISRFLGILPNMDVLLYRKHWNPNPPGRQKNVLAPSQWTDEMNWELRSICGSLPGELYFTGGVYRG